MVVTRGKRVWELMEGDLILGGGHKVKYTDHVS